jgi:hypothetical protein
LEKLFFLDFPFPRGVGRVSTYGIAFHGRLECNIRTMRGWRPFLLLCGLAIVAFGVYGVRLVWRGFSTANEPSYLERVVARTARKLAIMDYVQASDTYIQCHSQGRPLTRLKEGITIGLLDTAWVQISGTTGNSKKAH